jgi:hypothetical protein
MQPGREIWTLVDVSNDSAPVVASVDGPGDLRLAVVFDSGDAASEFIEAIELRNTIAFPFESLDFALETLDELPSLGITHFVVNPLLIDTQACLPIQEFVADVRNRLRMRVNRAPIYDRSPAEVSSLSAASRV